ncbi:NUDIX hydrolase [Almyronema epifaneia]|uniref:NUDIX hydrolase n=1 Tax=Almyronema epifaneia S1 TaxID=2991925 RepID=A0ABW6IDF0_9CYAN
MSCLQPWKLLRSQLVFNHRWCQVRQDTVRLPSGEIIDDYFVNVRPDVALVMPILPDERVVFVRQYRHGVQKLLTELPAGTFNPQQETAAVAAQRELQEETGYTAACLTHLGTLYDNPVKDTNQIHLFLAEMLTAGTPCLDVTEAIELELIPLADIPQQISQGHLQVAGTLAALTLGMQVIQQRASL